MWQLNPIHHLQRSSFLKIKFNTNLPQFNTNLPQFNTNLPQFKIQILARFPPEEISLFSRVSKPAVGPTWPPIPCACGSFREQSGRNVNMTAHLHLVLRLRMHGAVLLLPPCVFMLSTRKTLHVPVEIYSFHFKTFFAKDVNFIETERYSKGIYWNHKISDVSHQSFVE